MTRIGVVLALSTGIAAGLLTSGPRALAGTPDGIEPRCGLADAKRLVRGPHGLVVVQPETRQVWGCADHSQLRRTPLRPRPCPNDITVACFVEASDAVLQGPVVGYPSTRIQRESPFATPVALRSIDLRTGRTLRRVGSLLRYPETTQLGGRFVDFGVARNGALAWIVQRQGAPDAPPEYEVRRSDAGGVQVLAAGADIDRDSLEVGRSRVRWTQGGTTRSATLR